MDTYTIAWLLWIAQFFAIEGPALFNKREDDTFTEHIREWFSLREKSWGWRARRAVLLGFLVWLPVHFFTGIM